MPENGVRTRKIAFPVLKILGNTEEENREHLEKNELKNGVRTQKKKCSPSGEQRGIQDNLENKKSGNKVVCEDEVENLFGLSELSMRIAYSL